MRLSLKILLSLGFLVVGFVVYSVYFDNGSGAGQSLAQNSDGSRTKFSWDEYPEFAEVLRPAGRAEFLTPHETDRAYGDPQAPVVIMEFFSYQCPHCRSFHEGSFQRIFNDYIATGLVYFVKRDFLLNDRSIGFELLAGAGAQCLEGEAQSLQFADLVFERQRLLASAANPKEALLPVFDAVGLEEEDALACMEDHRNRSLVLLRAKRAQLIAQVTSTPTLFINQEPYLGNASDYNALRTAIERAIADAN